MIDLIIKKMKVQSYGDYAQKQNNQKNKNDDKILNTDEFLEND